MNLVHSGKKYREYKYSREDEFEADIVSNSKLFFGSNSIYIDAKRKIESKSLGGSIPDGILFDLSDIDNPEFYLIENELSSHDFFNHIFPQITKFFAFYKNRKSQSDLVEKIFSIINTDAVLKQAFKTYLGEMEIFKFVKDTIENSQNILLIIDDDMIQLPEIIDTYTDTWGKMVKVMIIKKFTNDGEYIFSLYPDFENIEYADADTIDKVEKSERVEYTEEYHLEGIDGKVKSAYFKIKESLLLYNGSLIFKPKKYVISIAYNRNIVHFQFRKKYIRLVVTLPYEDVLKEIKFHKIKELSESAQRFWNSPSCEIIIDSDEHIDEVIELIKSMIVVSDKSLSLAR
jgi:predicted transport protein